MSDIKKDVKPEIDFITSVLLMLLSVFIFVVAIYLPRSNTWLTAPGLMPLILSVSLFLLALYLMVYTLRRVNVEKKQGRSKGLFKNLQFSVNKKLIYVIVVTFIYLFVLLERMYFEISSSIFLFFTIKIFWGKGKLVQIILISIILPALLCLIFNVLFALLLPGDSLLLDLMILISRRI